MLCFGTVALAQDSNEGEPQLQKQACCRIGPKMTEELDPNDPLYWAKMRDVFTVQKRPFIKEGKFSATVFAGVIPNNIFEQYFPLGARFNYFILENIGRGVVGVVLAQERQRAGRHSDRPARYRRPGDILIGDTQRIHSSLAVLWSPFYGKTSFYNSALNYFDLYVAAGAGVVVTETQPDFNRHDLRHQRQRRTRSGRGVLLRSERGACAWITASFCTTPRPAG